MDAMSGDQGNPPNFPHVKTNGVPQLVTIRTAKIKQHLSQDDKNSGDSNRDETVAAIRDLPGRLHTNQLKTKLLQTQIPVFELEK